VRDFLCVFELPLPLVTCYETPKNAQKKSSEKKSREGGEGGGGGGGREKDFFLGPDDAGCRMPVGFAFESVLEKRLKIRLAKKKSR
jgi:hypothetical protein